uniref:Uncharacterized protein n=1 Tax=Timema douglasi TaxID=61478 RepID=A0A7R8Z3S5_TIMDO|nr:unnamed protein product [Timema douglasi]
MACCRIRNSLLTISEIKFTSQDSNPDIPVIGRLVYCDSSVLDHAAIEEGSCKLCSVLLPIGPSYRPPLGVCKILETLSLKHLPNAQIHVDPSYLPPISPSQIATRPCTPLSPLQKSSSGPVTAHMLAVAHGTNPQFLNQHGDHQSAVMYESIRHKMTDSMAKLAGLSSSPIMGNPRVIVRKIHSGMMEDGIIKSGTYFSKCSMLIDVQGFLSKEEVFLFKEVLLPQNMATILTLAALQEQRQSGGKGAASPSHDPNKTPGNI